MLNYTIAFLSLLAAQIFAVWLAYLQANLASDLKTILTFPLKYIIVVYLTTVFFSMAYAFGIKVLPFAVIALASIGLNFVLSLLVTYYLFNQQINLVQWIGIGLILMGLWVINGPALVELLKK